LSDVLADTSAWVAFLRGEKAAVQRIDPLLVEGRVAIARAVYAEVLSGTALRADFELLGGLLEGLEWLPEPANVWERVAEARFTLARRGFQAAILDLIIALCALEANHTLLTRDRDFTRIQTVLPFQLEVF
jgi:predicted nucleic acid-binding protein